MNKSSLLTFVVLQIAVLSSAYGAPYTTKAESSASESSGPEGVAQTVTNSSFAFTSLYSSHKQNYTDGLLAQKIESTSIQGKEGAMPKLEVTAWIGGKNKYDTKLWTINDCADAGWQSGDFYWTSKYGWDGAENLLRAYNMKTGKYVYTFTTPPAFVDVYIPKEVVKRSVAYVSQKGADSECRKNEMPKNGIGIITLSDGETQVDRVLLEAEDVKLGASPKIVLTSDKEPKGSSALSVWGPADYSSKSDVVKGFSVKVIFASGVEATIPVANDKLDIQHAILPDFIKIRHIGAEKQVADKS